MKTLVQTLPASQVVGRLYAELGALRAWADFLSDNIRGKQNLALYEIEWVAQFIVRPSEGTRNPIFRTGSRPC
jgi:hypothetical protein